MENEPQPTRDEKKEPSGSEQSAHKRLKLYHGKCVSCKKESVAHFADTEYVLVKITREQFLEGATELITRNGRPSKIFNDSA